MVLCGEESSRQEHSRADPPLVESERARAVVRGWFRPPRGQISVEDLATFRFSCDDHLVHARHVPGAPYGELIHSFYGTATPLFAWACWGIEAIHASAASGARGVVAFCGPSGAGKSTMAYAMAARGRRRFGEDAVAFRMDRGAARAVALPFTTNLHAASVGHFARRRTALPLPSPTQVYRFEEDEDTLAAVVLLDRAESVTLEPRIAQLSPSEALLAILPNAYRFRSQPAERERRMLDAYLSLVADVPIFRLTYGQDFDQIDTVLDRVEAATGL